MNARFTGNSKQSYLSQASKNLHKRIRELKDGTRKPRDFHDYAILNPEIVDTVFNRIKNGY